jgi:hypothetical protein
MSDLRTYTVELKERQFEYLTRMMEKYELPDESKVLRVLINHAIVETEREREVFEEVRCVDC